MWKPSRHGKSRDISNRSPKVFQLSIVCGDPKTVDPTITGWWLTYPSEKYENQLGLLFPTEWKVIKFIFQTINQITKQYQKNDPESQSAKTLAAPPGLGFDIRPAQSWHRDGIHLEK